MEQLNEKVTKLEMQPLHAQGFMTSSSQNLSNPFGNLSTSFQVKADLDNGKFSGTEPIPSDKLMFDQWCIDVKSYQASYPDRVPKRDRDKILKDHFFYGIKSDIRNNIRHLYDDETVTFSQILVKAHRNEEEDTTSKLLSKSAVADSILKNKVGRLIERSNDQFNSNPNKINWDNSCNYGRPPFQQGQRSRGDFWTYPRSSVNNVWQNLRGPEPSVVIQENKTWHKVLRTLY